MAWALFRIAVSFLIAVAVGHEAWGGEWAPHGPVLYVGTSYELNLWDRPNIFCEDGGRITGMIGIKQTVYRKGNTLFVVGYAHDSCLSGTNTNDRNVFDRVTATIEVTLW